MALFGHFDRAVGRRVTILIAGLGVAVPFTLGFIWHTADPQAHALITSGAGAPEYPAWVGILGGLLAYYLRVLGPVGEGLLAVGALSGLTIGTIGWSPFAGLRKGDEERGARSEGVRGCEGAGVAAKLTTPSAIRYSA